MSHCDNDEQGSQYAATINFPLLPTNYKER
jgi:hypothetical protein